MKIKVVIAEDQPDARKGLELMMAFESDFEVVGSASNGVEAIEAIQSLKPDLILLDIQMPGATGFEVLNILDDDIILCVVFITAYDEFAIKAFEIHAVDYLLKPYTDNRYERGA